MFVHFLIQGFLSCEVFTNTNRVTCSSINSHDLIILCTLHCSVCICVYVYTQVLKQIENNIYRRERKWQSCCIHSYNFLLFSTWQLEGSIHIIASPQLKVPSTSFIIYSIKVHFFLLSLLETTTSETKLLLVFSVKEQFLSEREDFNESLTRKGLSLVSNKSLIGEGLSPVFFLAHLVILKWHHRMCLTRN